MPFVSRAGEKLDFAITTFTNKFGLSVSGKICVDLGCSTGGFTDCLLQHGAKKVYSVDTAYGELAWNLRNNPKVVVLERTNALHLNEEKVVIPEKADVIVVDTAWTKQSLILKQAKKLLSFNHNNLVKNTSEENQPAIEKCDKFKSFVITLIKPHYEAEKSMLYKGVLKPEYLATVLNKIKSDILETGFDLIDLIESPIEGKSGGNKEFLALLVSN